MSTQLNENEGSYTDYLYKKEAKGKVSEILVYSKLCS